MPVNKKNEPQLSAIEKMALKYNIPLADLESLLATALEEQKKEIASDLLQAVDTQGATTQTLYGFISWAERILIKKEKA